MQAEMHAAVKIEHPSPEAAGGARMRSCKQRSPCRMYPGAHASARKYGHYALTWMYGYHWLALPLPTSLSSLVARRTDQGASCMAPSQG